MPILIVWVNWFTIRATLCKHEVPLRPSSALAYTMLSELLLTEINRLNQNSKLPLHRQLYEALRRTILGGKLQAGERLPSSRDLMHDLHLSRNTVVAALNQLSVEGYLVSRVGPLQRLALVAFVPFGAFFIAGMLRRKAAALTLMRASGTSLNGK